MKSNPLRPSRRPLIGLEHRETTSRLLKAILICGLIIVLGMIVIRVLSGGTLATHRTLRVLLGLFLAQGALLWMVWRGYERLAAVLLVAFVWALTTYQAWNADGLRDSVIYVYIVVMLIAALLTSWRFSIVVSVLSVACFWVLAIAEARGVRAATTDTGLNLARDLTAIFGILVLLVYLVIDTIRNSLHAIRAGEQRFGRIFHLSPVAIAIASLEDGRLIDANEAFWRFSGFDSADSIGKTTVELGIWSSTANRSEFVRRLKEQKSLHEPAYKFRTQTGDYRTTLAFYELIDLENEPAILAMFYDHTEQDQAQLALQASEQKYRNFIEQSIEGIGFFAFDQPISLQLPAEEQARLIYEHGFVSECNDVLAHLYGYSSSATLRGTRLRDMVTPDQWAETYHPAIMKLAQAGYRSGNSESSERTRDGHEVYFLDNVVGLIEEGCLVGLWRTQLDITALKHTEQALRRSEAQMRALLAAIPDMIFEIRRDGTILQFISSSGSQPLISPDQFLGKTLQNVLPSVAGQTSFAVERVLESRQVHAFEYQLLVEGENRTYEARLAPSGTDTVLAMVRDVSLQKWILGEREQLINELESKNAELERFTYTVSHDLKAPIITIKGFLGFLRQDAQSGNMQRLESDIQRISHAADRMQRLLNDLLELSRIGRLVNQPETFAMNEMVTEVLELLDGRLRNASVEVQVQADLPDLYGDRQRLFEVLQNLVDNAAKFMGTQPQPRIEIGQLGLTAEGAPILFVRDNGVGIEPQFKDRIFGLFDKLDPQTDGTGIGLALAKRIIEFHGGRIWVESELGHGATFYFWLPRP